MKKGNKRGFTLIELITVVAIISVLAAISVPSLASIMDLSKESACHTQIAIYQNAYNIICLENPTITKNTDDIVTFLLEQNVIDEAVSCNDGGHYYLENGIIYCSLHPMAASGSDGGGESSGNSATGSASSSASSSGSSSGTSSVSSTGSSYGSSSDSSGNSNNSSNVSSSVSDSSNDNNGNNGNTGENGNLTGVTSYDFKTKKYKNGGFEYTLTVYNTGKVNISNWVVEFTYPGDITSAWTASLTQLGGNRYRFGSCDYNNTIPYQDSVTITGNGTTWNGTKITGFSVKTK